MKTLIKSYDFHLSAEITATELAGFIDLDSFEFDREKGTSKFKITIDGITFFCNTAELSGNQKLVTLDGSYNDCDAFLNVEYTLISDAISEFLDRYSDYLFDEPIF